MSKKILSILARTAGNVIALGIITGTTAFALSLLKESGQKFAQTLEQDIQENIFKSQKVA